MKMEDASVEIVTIISKKNFCDAHVVTQKPDLGQEQTEENQILSELHEWYFICRYRDVMNKRFSPD